MTPVVLVLFVWVLLVFWALVLAVLWALVRILRQVPPPSTAQTAQTPQTALAVAYTEDLAVGRDRWGSLITTWVINFDALGEQPDRMSMLMAVAAGAQSKAVVLYIRSRGGLAGATLDSLLTMGFGADTSPMLAKKIALNIVQVGTVAGLPMDKLLERSLYCRPEDLETAKIGGGTADDTIDINGNRTNPFTHEKVQ